MNGRTGMIGLTPSMPSGWAALFWGVLTFSVLILLHEGGHFVAARLFGVKVHEFMLGLPGPALRWRSKKSGVVYGVTAIPLGGYVRIAGMEPGAEDELLGAALHHIVAKGHVDEPELAVQLGIGRDRAAAILASLAEWGAIAAAADSHGYGAVIDAPADLGPAELLDRARSVTYRGRKTWQRVVILAMGVLCNLAAAILIFTVTLSVWGLPQYSPTLTLKEVTAAGPSAMAGIRAGDSLVSLDGVAMKDWEQVLDAVAARKPGDTVVVMARRAGGLERFEVVLGAKSDGHPLLGVMIDTVDVPVPLSEAFSTSLQWTGLVFVAIADFFRPSTFSASISSARSVVGISYEVAKAAEAGPIQYAWMIAFLSLSLGALNILPIPPLDGGKVAVEIVERLFRRPLRKELSYALSALGAMLLFSLIFYLMYADIMRYIVKG
jgi:regulator of sigma E protease